MTTDQHKEFFLGRDYWWQYIKINGYSFSYTEQGIRNLSKNLDLTQTHIKKCINRFLSA